MKTKLALLTLLLATISLFAQNSADNYLIKWKDYEIGGYVGLNGKMSKIWTSNAGYGDIKAAVTINGKWAVGLSGTALYFDKKLNRLVNDGTYHLNAAYGGLFVERIFSLSDNWKISASLLTGQGEVSYIYDKDFREDRPWYQEAIDKEAVYVTEISLDVKTRLYNNFWVGLTGSYRNTSPLRLIKTSDALLQKFNYGISITYGIF
ncbi:MAG: hypothetical protein CVV23_10190 [Ignavibacteriae bacterium HGW-Ignavibacteriae-2]|jgi:hypothetical protein|nr:MAG: hypothetical protein CVV23_10190 [Ignavibacteriae bacterium HGW-Ignavibacteriae-2]